MDMVNIVVVIATIVIFVAGIAVAFAVHLWRYKNFHYVCPKCSNAFKPSSFLKSFFGLNLFSKRGLRCTKCDTFVAARTTRDKHTD